VANFASACKSYV